MVYVVLAFFVFILWALTTQPDTLTALLVTPLWFVLLFVAWIFVRRSPNHWPGMRRTSPTCATTRSRRTSCSSS